MIYLRYLKTLLTHKFYVGVACFKMGLYWQGLIHDWSKFSPLEFVTYAKRFSGGINTGRDKSGYYDPTKDVRFKYAWCHHYHHNPHHWQYWAIPKDNLDGEPEFELLDIPEKYLKEMLCDWHGASKAYKGKGMIHFWENNKTKLRLSPKSYAWIDANIHSINERLG